MRFLNDVILGISGYDYLLADNNFIARTRWQYPEMPNMKETMAYRSFRQLFINIFKTFIDPYYKLTYILTVVVQKGYIKC